MLSVVNRKLDRLIPEPRAVRKSGDDTPASSLIRYVWRMSGLHQVWLCLLSLGVAGLSMLPLELQRRIIDDAVASLDLDLLTKLVIVYFGVLLIHGGAKLALRLYQGWLSESAVRYTREHLAEIHASRTGPSNEKGEGRAVSVAGAEVDKLGGFVGEGLSQPFVNAGMLVAIVGYMLTIQPWVALLSLVFLIPQIVLVPLVQRFINALIEDRLALMREVSDTLVAMPQSSSGRNESGLLDQFNSVYVNRIRTFVFKFGLKAVVNLLNSLAPLGVLAVGGYMVVQGETTVGVVVAFISGFDRLSGPVRELIAYYRVAAQAGVQHKMIAEWMA